MTHFMHIRIIHNKRDLKIWLACRDHAIRTKLCVQHEFTAQFQHSTYETFHLPEELINICNITITFILFTWQTKRTHHEIFMEFNIHSADIFHFDAHLHSFKPPQFSQKCSSAHVCCAILRFARLYLCFIYRTMYPTQVYWCCFFEASVASIVRKAHQLNSTLCLSK